MSNILLDTINLQEKLKKSEQTGLIAWEIGEIAKRVKNGTYTEIKNGIYPDFGSYTLGELGKTEQTIDIYIKIHELYPNAEDIHELLVTHLKELIRLSDKEMREIATQQVASQNKENQNEKFSADDIEIVVNILKMCNGKVSREEIINTFRGILRQKQEKKRAKRVTRDTFGPTFRVNDMVECVKITEHIEREPIDEQGFVAVFCFIFDCLKKIKFELAPNDKINFSRIKFIRTAFPDAVVHVKHEKKGGKEGESEIHIELEYQSRNYFKHKHQDSEKSCHMIIAWENDLNPGDYPEQALQKLPPIFSVRAFLYEGKTELYNASFEKLRQKAIEISLAIKEEMDEKSKRMKMAAAASEAAMKLISD